MEIEIHTHNWDEVDIHEVAQLIFTARRASPFWRPDQNLDWFQQFIHQRKERFSPSFVILARSGESLVGMTTIITEDPTIYDLWRWHPVVLPGENETEIATTLIKASINQMKAVGAHSLEVCFDFNRDEITPETETYYQKYTSWYELCGAVIFILLAACSSAEPAATPSSSATISANLTIAPQVAKPTAVPTPTISASQKNPPIIDGVLSPGEWNTAVVENLTGGSELLLMQDDNYLYLGVHSATPEMVGANVFVEEGEQVRILHTSAALGTAVYQQNGDIWQQIQAFDWQCRGTGDSAAQAERATYLQQNHWLAANSRMGAPNELEYQIKIADTLQRIAVNVFRSSAPNERVFWPPTLDDDTIQPNPGGLPIELHFSPELWAMLASIVK